MAKAAKFEENGATKKSYNDSLFEKLHKDRTTIIEKFPKLGAVGLPETKIKLGDATYKFKLGAEEDNFSCSGKDGSNFRARYKKSSKEFDIQMGYPVTVPMVEKCVATTKYEERGTGVPSYVQALSGTVVVPKVGDMEFHKKINLMNGNVKASALLTVKDLDVKAAVDLKTSVTDPLSKKMKWNAGLSAATPLGITTLAYNSSFLATLTQSKSLDKKCSVLAEVAQKKDGGFLATAGVLYKDCAATGADLRCRVNSNLEVGFAAKVKVSDKASVEVGTNVDLKKPEAVIPALGFKIKV